MENMKLSKSTWIFLWVMICSCITTSGLVSAAEKDADKAEVKVSEKILHDADALINSGKPAEAYALLSPLDFDYSGNARFDYLLGIAALDSGHADKATLVFERVLAVDPSFAGARLDMARAYFQLGDMVRAKTEFDEVMKQSPPEAARATIQKYLAAIDAKMHALGSSPFFAVNSSQ
jgi:tetratricopeptide (TPR) repeat protein